jgi:hypothetical protein
VSPPGIAWTERKQATLGGVTPDSPGFDRVRAESAAEGHRMLDRFAEHWHDGTNLFDRPGEVILGAFLGDELIGICGRNRDPSIPTRAPAASATSTSPPTTAAPASPVPSSTPSSMAP